MKVTKGHLSKVLVREMAYTNKYAMEMVNLFFDDISAMIIGSQKVLFSSFGVFNCKKKRARIVMNPQTGVDMTLPARCVVTFRPTVKMRKAVNGGQAGRSPSVKNLYPGTIEGEVEAKRAARVIMSTIKDALIWGDGVEIRGFGSFSIRNYPGYLGINPKTGEIIGILPKKLPFFKPSKKLLKRANA